MCFYWVFLHNDIKWDETSSFFCTQFSVFIRYLHICAYIWPDFLFLYFSWWWVTQAYRFYVTKFRVPRVLLAIRDTRWQLALSFLLERWVHWQPCMLPSCLSWQLSLIGQVSSKYYVVGTKHSFASSCGFHVGRLQAGTGRDGLRSFAAQWCS